MSSTVVSKETLVLAALLVGIMVVNEVLPIGDLPSILSVIIVVIAGVLMLVPGAWETLYRVTGIGVGAWLFAIGFAATGIAASYVFGSPQPYCEGLNPYRGCLTAYGWASAIYIASSLGVAVGAGHLDRYRRLRRASSVAADGVHEGIVAVEGRIKPAGTTLNGPVSDEETVWFRRATETSTLFGGHRELEQEVVGNKFYVTDGSGRLLVLPEHLDAHDVGEFATSHTADEGDTREREWSFKPDDAVTVVGVASAVSRAEFPEPYVVGLEGPAIVGTRTLSEIRSWAAQRALIGGALGVVVGGVALLVMLMTA